MARVLLDHVVAWYEERADPDDPTAPTPLPARRYLAGGAPREVPWDDPVGQVTVALERVMLALDPTAPPAAARSPRRPPGNVGRLNRSVAMELQIVRCAPALSPTEVLDAHGTLVAADAGHLMTAVTDAVQLGVLLREHVAQAPVLIGDLVTLGPSGAAAAVAVSVTVPLL